MSDPTIGGGIDISATQLGTPCLILEEARMMRNIERLRGRIGALGAHLNPHLKTTKSIEIARRVMEAPEGPCTVSTLFEAEVFADAGVRQILYAVGIAPNKLSRVLALLERGIQMVVLVDNIDQARLVAGASAAAGTKIPVLVEIDTDGHRAGIKPDADEALVAVARALEEGGAELRGVLTHAGDSYNRFGREAIERIAEQERAGAVRAAETLRANGFACPVVSVGSTPTAHFVRNLTGVTEVRAGVFVFFDLVMAGLGVCSIDDIAISVLATVIGHKKERNSILIDAGWMALSRDRGTARQSIDQGYGLVCDLDGRPFDDLIVAEANQEHGIVSLRPGSDTALPDLPYGSRVRILPNHACATAAQHDRYHVVDLSRRIQAIWPRFHGW